MIKNYILLIIFILISSFGKAQTDKNKKEIILHSNVKNIFYTVNGEKIKWTISPETKPDVAEIPCENKNIKVTFVTDVDSVHFVINVGDAYRFIILLNNKDSAYTEIKGIKHIKQTSFDKKYITGHTRKVFVEVPEVQELVHIVMAITEIGQRDSNMVLMTTPYYKKVLTHFLPFKNELIVLKIDSLLKDNLFNYTFIKMNSYAFIFKGNKIINEGIYSYVAWSKNQNKIEPYISLLETFAKKTNFKKFYKDNLLYYQKLIEEQKQKVPVEKMWAWLEKEFPNRYSSYKITFSPLVNGSHSTLGLVDDNFSETIMFICSPERDSKKHSEKVFEGILSRIVFTEIDHNYVNPVSDVYREKLDQIFQSQLSQWADPEKALKAYPNAFAVFNEYMTFGAFSLYIYDHFSKEDFEKINQITENMMVNSRKFIRFKEFNQYLLSLYKNKPKDKKVADLYPEMLDWCEKQK